MINLRRLPGCGNSESGNRRHILNEGYTPSAMIMTEESLGVNVPQWRIRSKNR